MREFSQDEALNREHDQFLSVTVAIYLGGGLFFLVAIALILRFEYPFDSLTKLGQVGFFLWLGALLYSASCANSGKGVFRLLDQWEQSLLRRKKDSEALRFPRFCGLGGDKGKHSHEQEQKRSTLRPGV